MSLQSRVLTWRDSVSVVFWARFLRKRSLQGKAERVWETGVSKVLESSRFPIGAQGLQQQEQATQNLLAKSCLPLGSWIGCWPPNLSAQGLLLAVASRPHRGRWHTCHIETKSLGARGTGSAAMACGAVQQDFQGSTGRTDGQTGVCSEASMEAAAEMKGHHAFAQVCGG